MNRWVRLWSAFVGMVMIGNLQYAWTLFAQPMVKAHAQQHWQLSDVQWGFGLFIAAGTWTMPFVARSSTRPARGSLWPSRGCFAPSAGDRWGMSKA